MVVTAGKRKGPDRGVGGPPKRGKEKRGRLGRSKTGHKRTKTGQNLAPKRKKNKALKKNLRWLISQKRADHHRHQLSEAQ